MKLCTRCKCEKPVDEFYPDAARKDGRNTWCGACCREQKNEAYWLDPEASRAKNNKSYRSGPRRALRDRNAAWLLEFLEANPCVSCGERDPVVLDLDHVRGEKVTSVANMVTGYSLEHIQEEVAKCQVLCANCHRKKTTIERGWFNKAEAMLEVGHTVAESSDL